MSKPLRGKVALVTGSCIGLGAAIAAALAQDGARVVLTGLPPNRGKALAKKLRQGSLFVEGDLRDVDETRKLMETVLKTCGGIDILVNNAAVSERSTLEEITPEHFDRIIHIILRAPLLLAQAALPSLKKRSGVILNVGSVNSYAGWQNLLVYSAAKAGLVTASKNMANALKYSRVRVYCINPGWIDTEGERAMMKKLGHSDDFLDKEGKQLPIGRLIQPSEVAEVVRFLVSDKAAAFSGTVVELEQFPIGCMTHPKATEPFQ
ncbi:MAG TPA: SDR family oxidoreductase [Planctomycetota bacterium]|nr:SDR family oxidoreductase [Planctomycetota bacterium]